MPVERHSERLATPLSRRERLLLALLGALLAATLAGVAIYAATEGSSSPRPGCISVSFAASVGGNTVNACGAKAREICRKQSSGNARVAEACRRGGIPVS